MWRISWLAVKLLASQEWPRTMQFRWHQNHVLLKQFDYRLFIWIWQTNLWYQCFYMNLTDKPVISMFNQQPWKQTFRIKQYLFLLSCTFQFFTSHHQGARDYNIHYWLTCGTKFSAGNYTTLYQNVYFVKFCLAIYLKL